MSDTVTTESTTAPAATEEKQAPPALTIGDLVLTAQIVQKASQAGLFRAEELKTVGDFYDRLIKFLEGSGAIQRTASPAETPAETPAA